MTRTQLQKKFLKDRSEENKNNYSKQRNYCVSLLIASKLDSKPKVQKSLSEKCLW